MKNRSHYEILTTKHYERLCYWTYRCCLKAGG